MGSILIEGNPPVEIHVRKCALARRLSLRVSGIDGRVTLTVPRSAGQRDVRHFAVEKADWIRDALARQAAPVVVCPGIALPVEGGLLEVVAGQDRTARIENGRLLVPSQHPGPAALAFLRYYARHQLAAAVARHAAALKREPGRLTLRDPRSRWGSCSMEGNLMFSWRLILAPPAVLEYVAAHEVAHLARMDHSPDFWRLAAQLCPNYARHSAWLRREGAELHRYRFD